MPDETSMQKLYKVIEKTEATLKETERQLMRTNILLGNQYGARYGTRMGFEKDGSRTKDGVVIWPERMVE